jgi:WS/DGAT/MGAT family acyltransferase
MNDVVLAVVAGAVRAYLDDRGERLAKPLVAGIPVGTDAPGAEPRLIGNRVSNLFTTLATDLDDPVERLRRIHVVTASAKQVQATLGMDMMSSWVEYTPVPLLRLFMRLYSRWRLADRHAPPINLVVSNVPGPPVPLYIDGARLTALYSVGPILEGAGLNVTVWSYDGNLYFAVLACRERVADAQAIADRFPSALSELTGAR